MPRFVFELEALLVLRRRAEEQEQRAVATLERERVALEDRLRAGQRTIIACKEDLRSVLGPGEGRRVDLESVRLQSGASFQLAAEAQRIALGLAGTHQRLAAARQKLVRATTARKAMERLRERRYEAWKREQAAREAREADEMTTMRAARSRGDWAMEALA